MNGPFGFPSAPVPALDRQLARGFLPRGWIDGLVIANDTSEDATNDIVINAGSCRSTARLLDGSLSLHPENQIDLILPVSLIKQLDVSWGRSNYDPNSRNLNGLAQGDGGRSGLRCPGSSISDTTWHLYVVGAPDQQPDVVAIDSTAAATVMGEVNKIGYSAYRRIGSILRASSAITLFAQHGDYFRRKTPVQDIGANNPGTDAVTATLSVPTGVVVRAQLTVGLRQSADSTPSYLLMTALADIDTTPALAFNHVAAADSSAGKAGEASTEIQVLTNTSAQIRYRVSFSDATLTVIGATRGWSDTRDRDA